MHIVHAENAARKAELEDLGRVVVSEMAAEIYADVIDLLTTTEDIDLGA